MLEQNISYNSPEVSPIGQDWVLKVSLNILSLGGLNLFESLRRGVFIVEWRQQTRFGTDTELLHFGRIEAKIMTRKRTHAHQLHLPLKYIKKHRELIEPNLSHESAYRVDTIIVSELSALVKILILIYIWLQILAIGVHGAELVYIDQFSSLADTNQLNKRRNGRVITIDRRPELGSDNEEFAIDELLVLDVKTGMVEASEELYSTDITIITAS